jgi:hypothetical protein
MSHDEFSRFISYQVAPLLPFLGGLSRRNRPPKTQKETARKRGQSFLRKAIELGQKANIISGCFYEEPTHGPWCLSCHIPEGREMPDLSAVVRINVQSVAFAHY